MAKKSRGGGAGVAGHSDRRPLTLFFFFTGSSSGGPDTLAMAGKNLICCYVMSCIRLKNSAEKDLPLSFC